MHLWSFKLPSFMSQKSQETIILYRKEMCFAYLKPFVLFILVTVASFFELCAQEKDSPTGKFGGVITASNNGVSIIPSFTLGRPALLFDLSLSGKRFSFEPMLRFEMNGKPWTFVFWGRYKIIKDKRFTLSVGGYPAYIFRERIVKVNGREETMFVSQRFLAGEVVPNYKISNRLSIGLYYLRGHGFNPIPPDNSTYFAFNPVISGIPVGGGFNMRINPQLFYLKVDDDSGTYATSNVTFSKPGFPIGFQGFVNQKIKSNIAGDDFIWSVGLLYIFSTPYKKVK